MTREELIKIIYDSCSTATCPEPMNCEKLSETDSCWNCAERVLADYENEIRIETTDDAKKNTLTEVLTVIQTEIDTCYSEWKKHTDKPTPEELTIQAAQIQTLMRTRDAVAKLL